MSNNLKVFLWILGTILAAGMAQFAISAADPSMSVRAISAHVVGAVATSLAALLVKLPQRQWTEEEREQNLKEKQ